MRNFLASLSILGLIAGCAGNGVAASGQETYDDVLAQALTAQKAAAAAGGEWRDVGDMLTKAAEAAKAGDMEKAMKLAMSAKAQSELGLKQAEAEKDAGSPSYLQN